MTKLTSVSLHQDTEKGQVIYFPPNRHQVIFEDVLVQLSDKVCSLLQHIDLREKGLSEESIFAFLLLRCPQAQSLLPLKISFLNLKVGPLIVILEAQNCMEKVITHWQMNSFCP